MVESQERIEYDADNQYRIDYNLQSQKERFPLNAVGPNTFVEISMLANIEQTKAGITDYNLVFCDPDAGSDVTGDGSRGNPFETPLHSINACSATVIPYICFLSGEELDFSGISENITSDYFLCAYADSEKDDVSVIYYALGYTPSDSNTIYIDSDNGDDGDAGDEAHPKATIDGAINALSGTKTRFIIQNSGTYQESGFSLSGCDGIYAQVGQMPTIKPTRAAANTTASVSTSSTAITSASAVSRASCILANCHVVHVFTEGSDIKYMITSMDGAEVFKAATVIDSGTGASSPAVARVDDDKFVITWEVGTGAPLTPYRGKFQIYQELSVDPWTVTGTLKNALGVVTNRSFYAGELINTAVFTSPVGNILILFTRDSDSKVYYQLLDSSGAVIKQTTETGFYYDATAAALSDDSWIIAGFTGGSPYPLGFIQVDYIGDKSRNITTVASAATQTNGISIPVFDDDDFAIVYEGTTYMEWAVYNAAGEYKSKTVSTVTSSVFGYKSNVVLNGDLAIVIFNHLGPPSTIKAAALGSDGVEYAANIAVANCASGTTYYPSIGISDTGTYYVTHNDTNGYLNASETEITVYWDAINVQTACEFRGLTIDLDDLKYCRRAVNSTANFTARWCELKNASFVNDHNGVFGVAVYSTGETTIKNSLIHNNGGGVYVENNVADIEYNAMYRQSTGWSIYVDGAGSDIVIDHNTMAFSPGGIRLINNDGSESIEHCILHDHDVNDVVADVSVTPLYCDFSGTSVNVASTTIEPYSGIIVDMVMTDDPIFINSGKEDNDLTDLRLQNTDVLDYADSPCTIDGYNSTFGQYPDDYKNLGCYDDRISQLDDNYTTAYIYKPRYGIKTKISFVGENNIELMDGSYSSNFDGTSEEIIVEHDGILNDEYTNILLALTGGGDYGNKIRWFGKPVTSSTVFGLFSIIYKDINGSANTYRLNRTGRHNVTYSIRRKLTDLNHV